MTSDRFWDRWLLFVGWGLVVFGLLLALLNRSWVFEQLLNRPVDAAFWPGRVEGVQRFQAWIYGVLGATVSGWGMFVVFMARHPFPRRQRWAWNCLCSGITLWYVLDTSISIAFGVYVNAALNSVVAALVYAPLFATKGQFAVRESG